VAFAVLGIVAGLVAGGTIYYREFYNKPAEVVTPEQTVEQFLTAVFREFTDPSKTAAVVCPGWDPADAIVSTRAEVPTGATVGWRDVRLMNGTDQRAVVGATITLTPFADTEPSDFESWSFSVVASGDDGWRVCAASPIG
jgi:hypothetical protein